MSIYSSINLTRSKARQLVIDKALKGTDDELKELADVILRAGGHYNLYRIVDDGDESDDDKV